MNLKSMFSKIKKDNPKESTLGTEQGQMADPPEEDVEFLEAAMEAYYQSEQKDEDALKLIIMALTRAPLYLPIEVDCAAMFGGVDVAQLKRGDEFRLEQDVKMRVLTMMVGDGIEIVPMFTSKKEVEKGPNVSVMRSHPAQFMYMLRDMEKDAVINPFNNHRFVLHQGYIREVLIPFFEEQKK